MKRLRLIFQLLSIGLLAACGSAPQETGELPTVVQLPTETATHSPTPTPDYSPTFTLTPSITLTPTKTFTSSITPSLTITNTLTRTPTPTSVDTAVPSFFDSLATVAASYTPPPTQPLETLIAILTQTPLFGGGGGTPGFDLTPGATSLIGLPPVPGATQAGGCQTPPGGFGSIYLADLTLQAQLGCPITPPVASTGPGASQPFETGLMVWVGGDAGGRGTIYVFNNGGGVLRTPDTYDPAVDPESGGEQPPPNLLEPVRGFGKVWRTAPDVRSKVGWATALEGGGTAITLNFERGMMMDISTRNDVLILFIQPSSADGTWRAVSGSY